MRLGEKKSLGTTFLTDQTSIKLHYLLQLSCNLTKFYLEISKSHFCISIQFFLYLSITSPAESFVGLSAVRIFERQFNECLVFSLSFCSKEKCLNQLTVGKIASFFQEVPALTLKYISCIIRQIKLSVSSCQKKKKHVKQ